MGELSKSLKKFNRYLQIIISHYKLLIIVLGLSMSVAVYYALTRGKQKYSAQFIVAAEQQKSSGWENLLAQFGMEVGGANPGGVFVGESLVKLFSLRSLTEKALLMPFDKNSPYGPTFADKFILDLPKKVRTQLSGYRFDKRNSSRSKERFDSKVNNVTDSALFYLYKYVTKEVIQATKPDKKQTFIHVNCQHLNDTLAIRFSEAMIKTVTNKYIYSITRNVRKSLLVLRTEADSIKAVMDDNIARNARNMDFNINPLQQQAKIEQNKSLIDMQISISLYGEVIKNLKLAELALKKQTPLIEVVDEPHFPLEKIGFPLYIYIIIGFAIGFAIDLLILYLDGQFDRL